jgi:hypothetical protein
VRPNRNRWLKRRPKGGRKLVVRNIHPYKMDVSLSDLGYKVPYGQTRDLLAPENGLDPDRVMRSAKGGSLRKRFDQGVLLEIQQAPPAVPPRMSVADPAEVVFPQRFKSFAVTEKSDLSDSVADAIIEDDDAFLKEMDEDREDGGAPVVAEEPEENEAVEKPEPPTPEKEE